MAWVYTVLVYTQETWPDLWVQCYFFSCYTDPYCQELAAAQKAQQAEWIGWVSEIDGFKTWTKQILWWLYSVAILSCQNKEYTVYWYVFPGTRGIRLTIGCSLHFFKCRRKQGEESLLRRLCFCQDLLKKKRLQEMNDMASIMPSEIDVFFSQRLGAVGGSGSPYNRYEKSEWIRHLPKIGRIQGVHFDFDDVPVRKAPNNCVWIATGNSRNSNIW